jgi:hypothetical protein
VNCADVAPARTVTLAGTLAEGAGPFKATLLAVYAAPPTILAGTETEETAGGITLRAPVLLTPP